MLVMAWLSRRRLATWYVELCPCSVEQKALRIVSWRCTPKSDVDGVAFQEKAGYMELLPVQGGAEGTEERVLALHTEECEKGEVTS